MIFEELTMVDFRQFAGSQTIRFATDSEKNITVIHGFNGAGKTTVLNAFTWLLYNELSPDFEAPDHLESDEAFFELKPGEKINVSVKADFADGLKKYSAKRTLTVEKGYDGSRTINEPARLCVTFIDEDGSMQEPRNPQDLIEQMLPRRLYPFFFFNGERIERLARADAYQEIDKGVKTLLDIELFDRAIGHLENEMSRRLREDIAKRAGKAGEEAQAALDVLNQSHDQLKDEISQNEANIAALEDEREAIDAKLTGMPDLAKWQAERRGAEQKEESIQRDLKQRKGELSREFSRSAYLILTQDLIAKAASLLDLATEKGEIPGPMKRQFVDDRLTLGNCICGTDLAQGSTEYNNVEAWRKKSIPEFLESALIVTRGQISSYGPRAEDCANKIKELQAIRSQLYASLKSTREELSELSRKIGDKDNGEDSSRLESMRRKVDEDLIKYKHEVKMNNSDLESIDSKIKEKQREIERLSVADAESKLAQRRLDSVSNVTMALRSIRQLRFGELRDDLSNQLSEVWNKIAIKDYRARLDNEFRLLLTKEVSGREEPVRGASTGEKQVLSLAFVGALLAKARSTFERNRRGSGLFAGGLYPLVIDSAFGSLENEYRRDVARLIPSLTPQLILLVSQSQFRNEVATELRTKIGREWILRCETTKNKSQEIEIRGDVFPYVVHSDSGFDKTVIDEVKK